MSRALVIVNPWTRRPETAQRVVRELTRRGWRSDLRIAPTPTGVGSLVREQLGPEHDVVAIVGGDGTVTQVAAALVGAGTPFGILPAGTGNLFAANLRVPRDPASAVRVLTTGRIRPIDLGRVEDPSPMRWFLVAAGVGFDARVMRDTPTSWKRRHGKLAYFATALALARTIRNFDVEITIDGATRQTSAAQIFVANVGEMGGILRPHRRFVPDDGRFDVVMVRATGPLMGALAAWETLRYAEVGEQPGGRVFRTQATEVRIATQSPEPVELDGDFMGSTPIVATIVPRGASVIVPRER